jgi:hypothetical protein
MVDGPCDAGEDEHVEDDAAEGEQGRSDDGDATNREKSPPSLALMPATFR